MVDYADVLCETPRALSKRFASLLTLDICNVPADLRLLADEHAK